MIIDKARGDRLTKAMGTRDISVTQLANALRVSTTAVTHWRQGKEIKLSHLINLCDILSLSPDWLLTGDEWYFLKGLTKGQQQAVVTLVEAMRVDNQAEKRVFKRHKKQPSDLQ